MTLSEETAREMRGALSAMVHELRSERVAKDELERRANALTGDNARLRQQVSALQEENTQLLRENGNLEERSSQAGAKARKSQARFDDLVDQHSRSVSSASAPRGDGHIKSPVSHLALTDDVRVLKRRLVTLEEDHDCTLQEQRRERRTHATELQTTAEAGAAQATSLDDDVRVLKRRLATLEEDHGCTLQEQRRERRAHATELQTTAEAGAAQATSLEAARARFTVADERRAALAQSLSQAEGRQEVLEATAVTATQRADALAKSQEQRGREAEALQAALKRALKTVERLKQKVVTLEAERDEAAALAAERAEAVAAKEACELACRDRCDALQVRANRLDRKLRRERRDQVPQRVGWSAAHPKVHDACAGHQAALARVCLEDAKHHARAAVAMSPERRGAVDAPTDFLLSVGGNDPLSDVERRVERKVLKALGI